QKVFLGASKNHRGPHSSGGLMALRKRKSRAKVSQTFRPTTQDELPAAREGVDITEVVYSVTYIRLGELLRADIARMNLEVLMESARSEQAGKTATHVVFCDEFQEVVKTDNGQPQ